MPLVARWPNAVWKEGQLVADVHQDSEPGCAGSVRLRTCPRFSNVSTAIRTFVVLSTPKPLTWLKPPLGGGWGPDAQLSCVAAEVPVVAPLRCHTRYPYMSLTQISPLAAVM